MSKSRQLSDAINSVDISESAPADAVTLDSSGNLLVGKTGISQATDGFEARADGTAFFTDTPVSTGSSVIHVRRNGSDGEFIQFINRAGSKIGQIGVKGDDKLYIGTDDTNDVGLAFDGDNNYIYPCDATGSGRDNAIDLGASGQRYKDLYLSGGVYLGGTGSANHLDDYEEGTWTPTYTDGSGGTYSSTYGNQAAQYVKIGKLVYINCEIIANNSLTSNGLTGGSELRVSGLPFPNYSVPQATGHIEANFDIPSGYTHTGFFIRNGGTSYVSFRCMGDNVAYGNATVTMLEGATGSRYVVISGFYVTNS